MTGAREDWHETNRRLLAAEIARVRTLLDAHARGEPVPSSADAAGAAPALAQACAAFELSPFERDVLLMAVAMELDGSFSAACAGAQPDTARAYPTFGLALAAHPDAHWSALAPTAPLRAWRLVELGGGGLVTTTWLRIDETVLHHLAGVPCVDERLLGLVEPLPPADELPGSQRTVADRVAGVWSDAATLVHVGGPDASARRAVAAAAAATCGLALCVVRAEDLPQTPDERDLLARLWERQALLGRGALLIESADAGAADTTPAAVAFAQRIGTPAVLAGREAPSAGAPLVRLEAPVPTAPEQELLWRLALGGAAHNGAVARVGSQFQLGADAIRAAGADARARTSAGAPLADALWEACRLQSRPRLESFAQRIEPAADWEELVLPEMERRTLAEIVLHVRHRALVYETWGFATRSARGLGISALFAGPSGTGKTMAAEVIARDLRLDLYRVDLSAVVSKYIGETEKNLRRVFDAAEEGGAILLFDEADALFGKRSEVKDSHDRYANIEVSYLLQRIETYRGLAILTTNLKGSLDPAFIRRVRFVVQFPLPGADARREIWRRIFPQATPLDGVDVDTLARLDVSGGAIRNIAIRAAFLAAGAGEDVRMRHLAAAARAECAKLERPVDEAEVGQWA
jgi:hypothetical protein